MDVACLGGMAGTGDEAKELLKNAIRYPDVHRESRLIVFQKLAKS